MYIWTGINIDSQVKVIKEEAIKVAKELGLNDPLFTLPVHVSLRISFLALDSKYLDIVNDITEYLKSVKPFDITVNGVELKKRIVWIAMNKDDNLVKLHNGLCEMLELKYGIPWHDFDKEYKFHATLFMSDDYSKLEGAYSLVNSTYVPNTLRVDKFVIGLSRRGLVDTYSVFKDISL